MLARSLALLGLASLLAPSAFAGFIATTGANPVSTPALSPAAAHVGDPFITAASGTLVAYTPVTPADPQLTGELDHFRYDLSGQVTAVNTAAGIITYAGTYDIYYDLGLDGAKDPSDPLVSAGTFSVLALFPSASSTATLSGSLTQTTGPDAPLPDFSYGGNPLVYSGSFTANPSGPTSTISGQLIQSAAVPEPASLSLLAIAATTLLPRRRSR